uniref:(northern house mosquito) hypothetical protein n=2 Tax=Culex pipiens TaxID=7175 RepID=A0A8D8A3I4_CULPI
MITLGSNVLITFFISMAVIGWELLRGGKWAIGEGTTTESSRLLEAAAVADCAVDFAVLLANELDITGSSRSRSRSLVMKEALSSSTAVTALKLLLPMLLLLGSCCCCCWWWKLLPLEALCRVWPADVPLPAELPLPMLEYTCKLGSLGILL